MFQNYELFTLYQNACQVCLSLLLKLLTTSNATCILLKGFRDGDGENDISQHVDGDGEDDDDGEDDIIQHVESDTRSKVNCFFMNLRARKPMKCPYLGPCTTCCSAPGGIGAGCGKTMWGSYCKLAAPFNP